MLRKLLFMLLKEFLDFNPQVLTWVLFLFSKIATTIQDNILEAFVELVAHPDEDFRFFNYSLITGW